MRVIAGTWGGRRLATPPGRSVRPTSDRVREALFSILGDEVVGAAVLDCYAGTGALGIEARSRGARTATFVESDRRTAGVLRANLSSLGLDDRVVVADVARCAPRLGRGRVDLVLADPPYAATLDGLVALLAALRGDGRLADARVVVERDRRAVVAVPAWLHVDDVRTYGDTALLLARAEAPHRHPPTGPPITSSPRPTGAAPDADGTAEETS